MHSEENKTHFPVHFYARLCSVWVSALSHACRNEVLLHFEGHAKCLLLIIFLNIFYAQNSLQSFESIYFFVSFRNIFNHMEVHHGDKTPGENKMFHDTWLVYDLYDLGCPNTFRGFLLWGHFQLTPLPHCPSDKTFVPDNITI